MAHISVRLHSSALRIIQLIMRLLLMLPPRPTPGLKLLYTGLVLAYLALIMRWRFSFNYNVNYDLLHDHFSRNLDLVNFVALVIAHFVVSMELLWLNCKDQLEEQFLRVRFVICEQIGYKVNLRRCRSNTNMVFVFLLLRVFVLLGTTVYTNLTSSEALLLITNFYSELLMILRCSEFTLHTAFVLSIYQELHDAAFDIISRLERDASLRQLPLKHISRLQQLHQLIWQIQRDIENNFQRSLVSGMLKYFLDTSVLPYWVYINKIYSYNIQMQIWCITEEFGTLLQIFIPCWYCTQCDIVQRKFRSIFHGVSVDRRSEQLNTALLRISAQLEQESCELRIGGFVRINNQMLGRFLIGVLGYTFVCIQYWNTNAEQSVQLDAAIAQRNRTN